MTLGDVPTRGTRDGKRWPPHAVAAGGSEFLRDKARTGGPAQGGEDEGLPRRRPRGSGALPSDADEPTEDVVVALDDNNDDNNADDDVEDVLNDHDEDDDK